MSGFFYLRLPVQIPIINSGQNSCLIRPSVFLFKTELTSLVSLDAVVKSPLASVQTAKTTTTGVQRARLYKHPRGMHTIYSRESSQIDIFGCWRGYIAE